MADPELTAWCEQHGVVFNGIKAAYVAEGWRGIVATRDLQPDEVILRVPERLLLTTRSALRDPTFTAALRRCCPSSPPPSSTSPAPHPSLSHCGPLTPFQLLACHLLHEVSKGPDSFWWPYLRQLPRSYTSLPNWAPEQAEELQLRHARDVAAEAAEAAREEWRGALPLLRELGLPKRFTALRSWQWAASSLHSRTMYLPWCPAGALTPYGDLHNYQPPPAPYTPQLGSGPEATAAVGAGVAAAGGPGACSVGAAAGARLEAGRAACDGGKAGACRLAGQGGAVLAGTRNGYPVSGTVAADGQSGSQSAPAPAATSAAAALVPTEPAASPAAGGEGCAAPPPQPQTQPPQQPQSQMQAHTQPGLPPYVGSSGCCAGSAEGGECCGGRGAFPRSASTGGSTGSEDARKAPTDTADDGVLAPANPPLPTHPDPSQDSDSSTDPRVPTAVDHPETAAADCATITGDGMWDEAGRQYCIVVRRPYRAGEQVMLCYGRHSNLELLEHYGFVMQDNPHDTALLDPGLLPLPAAARSAPGAPPLPPSECFLHASGQPGWALLHLLRHCAASPAERRSAGHRIAAGEAASEQGDHQVLRWLHTACLRQLAALPSTLQQDLQRQQDLQQREQQQGQQREQQQRQWEQRQREQGQREQGQQEPEQGQQQEQHSQQPQAREGHSSNAGDVAGDAAASAASKVATSTSAAALSDGLTCEGLALQWRILQKRILVRTIRLAEAVLGPEVAQEAARYLVGRTPTRPAAQRPGRLRPV